MSDHALFFAKNVTRTQYNSPMAVSYLVNQYPV
jgi:hypothetical protein